MILSLILKLWATSVSSLCLSLFQTLFCRSMNIFFTILLGIFHSIRTDAAKNTIPSIISDQDYFLKFVQCVRDIIYYYFSKY